MRRHRWNIWSRRLAAALGTSAVIAVGLGACDEVEGYEPEALERADALGATGWRGGGGEGTAQGLARGAAAAPGFEGERGASAFEDLRARSDAEIAHAVLAIHQAEILHAALARVRASDPRVREHAERAIAEHAAALREYGQAVWQLGLSPAYGPLSLELERRARTNLATLARLTGPDFDAAYVASRLDARQTALSLLESQLLPGVAAGAHRRALDDHVLPTVSTQLRQASTLESELGLRPPPEEPEEPLDPSGLALDEPFDEPFNEAPGEAPLNAAPPGGRALDEADLVDRELGAPRFDDPEFQDPEFQDPEFQDPEFPDPEFADPEFADPEFADPEFADPEFADPEFADPRR